MLRRRTSVVLLLLALLAGVGCSSDDESERPDPVEEDDLVESGDASRAITEEDLVDVPIEEICTSMGRVSEYYLEGQAIGGAMPDIRVYFEEETPEVVATLRDAAEISPDELAAAMEDLAGALEARAAQLAALTDAEFIAQLLTPDPEIRDANVILNSFLFPQCGFDLPL